MNPTSLFRFILAFFLIATVAAAPHPGQSNERSPLGTSVDLQVQGFEKRSIEKRDIMTCAICLASYVLMGANQINFNTLLSTLSPELLLLGSCPSITTDLRTFLNTAPSSTASSSPAPSILRFQLGQIQIPYIHCISSRRHPFSTFFVFDCKTSGYRRKIFPSFLSARRSRHIALRHQFRGAHSGIFLDKEGVKLDEGPEERLWHWINFSHDELLLDALEREQTGTRDRFKAAREVWVDGEDYQEPFKVELTSEEGAEVSILVEEEVEVKPRGRVLLVGEEAGEVFQALRQKLGAKVGYFPCPLDPEYTGLDLVRKKCSSHGSEPSPWLNLLSDTMKTKHVRDMAVGQKARLSLLLLAIEQPNAVLLKEPTRGMSPRFIEVLVVALREFKGRVVMLSQDSRFLNEVEMEVVVCEEGTVRRWHSGVMEWQFKAVEKMLGIGDGRVRL
ncbi:hypothetical protein BDD12DRAFT_910968 [Trichophaea hybrida]|nr:hypothetical protein BDD12DRAFT_910968 [Trichophaea hybrida]